MELLLLTRQKGNKPLWTGSDIDRMEVVMEASIPSSYITHLDERYCVACTEDGSFEMYMYTINEKKARVDLELIGTWTDAIGGLAVSNKDHLAYLGMANGQVLRVGNDKRDAKVKSDNQATKANNGNQVSVLVKTGDLPITCLALSQDKLAVGTEHNGQEARILLIDLHTNTICQTFSEMHSDDITTLLFHPQYPDLLLSGGMDSLVNIIDTSVQDLNDACIETINIGSSVHLLHLLNPTTLIVASHMEQISAYTLDLHENSNNDNHTIVWSLPSLTPSYVIAITDQFIYVGNTHDKTIEQVPMTKLDAPDLKTSLKRIYVEAHHGEIVRAISADGRITIGEDGYLCFWSESQAKRKFRELVQE